MSDPLFKVKISLYSSLPRLKKRRVSFVINCSCGYTFRPGFVSVFFSGVTRSEREIMGSFEFGSGDSFEFGSGRI